MFCDVNNNNSDSDSTILNKTMVRTVLIFIFIVWSINVNTNHTLVECDRLNIGNKKKIMFHPHAKKNINDNFFLRLYTQKSKSWRNNELCETFAKWNDEWSKHDSNLLVTTKSLSNTKKICKNDFIHMYDKIWLFITLFQLFLQTLNYLKTMFNK